MIKATVFLADINDFAAVNEIYREFFTEDFPARAAIQVNFIIWQHKRQIPCYAQIKIGFCFYIFKIFSCP